MSLEYLSSNAINKYPFDDSATLKSNEGPFLPNDTFLDAVIASKREDIAGAFLASYSSNTGTSLFTIGITYFNSANTTIGTINVSIPFASVQDKSFFGVSNADVSVKIVFGQSFVNDKLATIALTFAIATTKFEQSAVILHVPRVKSVGFFNWDNALDLPNAAPEELVTADELTDVDLVFEEGSNVALTSLSGATVIDIIAREGTGLYNPCDDELDTIKTINFIGPESSRNFLLLGDDCYTTTPATNGLLMENSCTPKCSSAQLANFAHYLNRVTDGMQWVSDYATTAQEAIRVEIDRYTNETLPTQNLPFYKFKRLKTSAVDDGWYYYSYMFGFFNPSPDDADISITLTTAGTVDYLRFRIGNTFDLVEPPPVTTPYLLEKTIPCVKNGFLEFVIYTDEGETFNLTGTYAGVAFNVDENLD